MGKFYSIEEVNTGRQTEFDVARTYSIVGMILAHCYECVSFQLTSGFGYIVTTLLGGFLGAPLFMCYMGAVTRYSKKSTPKGLAIRGSIIFGLAYVLNIFRRIIPTWILAIRWKEIYPLSYSIALLVGNDILQFAGLALITIALVKKFRIRDWTFITFSVVLSIIGMLTDGFDTGSQIGNSLLGVLIGTRLYDISGGFFSYCHYLIFVAAGYAAGEYWKHIKDKKSFYKRVSPVSAVIFIAAFAIEIRFGFGLFGSGTLRSYYYMSLYDAVICLFGGLFMLGIYYWIDHILGEKFHRFCLVMSYNIDIIYFFHLILATWILNLLVQGLLGIEIKTWMILLTAAVLTAASYVFAKSIRDPNGDLQK